MLKTDDERSPLRKSLPDVTNELGSHLYLYQILEETPNGVMVISLNHQILYANPSANELLGVEYRNLTETDLEGLLGEENKWFFYQINQFFDNLAEIQRSSTRQVIQIQTGVEEVKILDAVLSYPPSSPDYYLLYLIDITERKRLETQLRRRNTFFNNLINSSIDGIIAADMKGRIILFNNAALSLLGYSDKKSMENFHVTSLYSEGLAYEIIKRMRSDQFGGKGKLLHHEISVKHADGHDIPVQFSGGIIYDRDKEYATFGIFTDLRAIMQIEEDLEQTHNMLMQSEKMAGLGRLAAGVAHEINNPMSGIMLYANLVQEELGEDHPVSEDLQTIIHEAERCKVIVADLLEFSHQTSYEREPLDLNEVIRKTLSILSNQPIYQNITIELNLSAELPQILGNSIRLNQVMMNLLVNAAQAMSGNGTLSITSRTRASSDINEILIRDTGPGIPENVIEKIFEPFFTTKITGEGTGLGLSVSYAIVKEHQGTIKVLSSSAEGTVFSLRFPALVDTLKGENHGE